MKKTLIILITIISLFATNSCKKKDKNDNNPLDNDNPINTNDPICRLATINYASTDAGGTNRNYTFSYNAEGFLSTYTFTNYNGTITTTENYTYTYDTEGKVTKRDKGAGNYTLYEYSGGKLSKFTVYEANSINSYTNIEYLTDLTKATKYNSSNKKIELQEFTTSGNNITNFKTTSYEAITTIKVATVENAYSNFDENYSKEYFLKKADMSLLVASKNNYKDLTVTIQVYNSGGTVTSTTTTTTSRTITINNSKAATQTDDTSIQNSSTTYTYRETNVYSNCN